MRVSTAGNVDDGKSTLVGRLLMETHNIPVDVVESIRKQSKDFPGGFDYSLVTDGLSSEQEQKITIDVAYRYFSTEKRQFILADTPGHVQYTRNMATGASTADLSIVLVDAAKGLTSQSRRHAVVSSLLGISHLIVAINKMDLVDYSEEKYEDLKAQFTKFSSRLSIKDIRFVPVSALHGDNVTSKSPKMPWYNGENLKETLDTIYTQGDRNRIDFRLSVQRVTRVADSFRGYAGQISSGVVRVGDSLAVLPNGSEVKVASILSPKGEVQEAGCLESVTLTFDREVDISRGDVLAPVNNLPHVGTDFEAILIWFDEEPLNQSLPYLLKRGTQWSKARIQSLRYRLDVETLRKKNSATLGLNDIGRAEITTFKPLVFDAYAKGREMGSFILVDPNTFKTAAAGMIVDRRARASKAVKTEVAKTVLFTGLSGAGKSTVASKVYNSLKLAGLPVTWLDGDSLRKGLSGDLGFSSEDRHENLRRMAEVAKLFNQEGIQVLGSFIAPTKKDRDLIKKIVGENSYVEVFVDAPLAVCQKRDPKGWYKKASAGAVKTFTGVDSKYEPPAKPDLILKTDEQSIDECVNQVFNLLIKDSDR